MSDLNDYIRLVAEPAQRAAQQRIAELEAMMGGMLLVSKDAPSITNDKSVTESDALDMLTNAPEGRYVRVDDDE
jgi:hypothetical protein